MFVYIASIYVTELVFDGVLVYSCEIVYLCIRSVMCATGGKSVRVVNKHILFLIEVYKNSFNCLGDKFIIFICSYNSLNNSNINSTR